MSAADTMACRELVELVTSYLDDALAPDERVRVERHLAACVGCETFIEQMRQTVAATASLGPEVIPPEGLERLLKVYREFRES